MRGRGLYGEERGEEWRFGRKINVNSSAEDLVRVYLIPGAIDSQPCLHSSHQVVQYVPLVPPLTLNIGRRYETTGTVPTDLDACGGHTGAVPAATVGSNTYSAATGVYHCEQSICVLESKLRPIRLVLDPIVPARRGSRTVLVDSSPTHIYNPMQLAIPCTPRPVNLLL